MNARVAGYEVDALWFATEAHRGDRRLALSRHETGVRT
jgi:hypothetical protein